MKLTNVALVSMMALGLVAVGCASESDSDNLGSSESLLVTDNLEIDDQDDALESSLEEPLSGAEPTDPGSPADGADQVAVLGKVKTNPGRWFQPAGCLTTTLAGNVATHVFNGCTGPYGQVSFNGTVTSTYTFASSTLTVRHEANGFKANGAEISGQRVVTYTKSATTITRKRVGTWTGATKNGKAFSHDVDFIETWDPATKCLTRSGSAQTSIAAREFSHSVTGYKRCGIGALGCPLSGKIVLERTKGVNAASVTVEFLGGTVYTATGPRGGKVTRNLVCTP